MNKKNNIQEILNTTKTMDFMIEAILKKCELSKKTFLEITPDGFAKYDAQEDLKDAIEIVQRLKKEISNIRDFCSSSTD
jgi:uncharacterized protein YfkK (UPF0435 family)